MNNLSGTIGGAKETLKHICAALSHEYRVPIELDDNSEGAHTGGKNTKVVIGTKNLSVYGLDYHVGLVLHEIAHIRFSPPPPKEIKKTEMLMLNMVEDERIDQLQKNEYEGAEYYLDELHNPTYEAVEGNLERPLTWAPDSHRISDLLDRVVIEHDLNNKAHGRKKIEPKDIERERNKRKSELLKRVIGFAYLLKERRATGRTTTGHVPSDELAKRIRTILQKATWAKKDEIWPLAQEAHTLLEPLFPDPGESETPTHYAMLVQVSGGKDVGTDQERAPTDNIYRTQDGEAIPAVDRLKRKLVRTIRENEHQKYTDNKRKGLLNKRALRRVALQNYRVYKKREQVKGQKYSVEIAIDTSGSMFNGHRKRGRTRIETAQYCAALLVRTFRALGFETGLSFFSNTPATVLHPKDRYLLSKIEHNISRLDGNTYGGGTNLHFAIEHSVKLLQQGRADTKKVLIIITDGEVSFRDICRDMLRKAEKKDGISTMIFYLDVPPSAAQHRRVLDDVRRERYVKNGDLIPACVELAKELTV